jgi:outer membrane protein assembly factor BamB
VGEGLALVGDEHGEIYALNTANGKIRWQQNVGQQVLALPTISNSITIVKTISDTVIALSTKTGQILWNYNVGAPTMILRGGSKPSIAGDSVITGFANGKMASLSLNQGNLNWMQTIATPQGVFEVQRMVDIDVAPIVKDMVIYDATYQGNLAAIELGSGQMIWNHKMSAYTGIALSNIGLYVTDANSEVWSFQADNGGVNWHQVALKGRQITAPALVSSYFDDYLIVGDDNGYLHWLSQRSGEFVARERLSWEPIRAVPVVKNGLIYVLDARGYIAAYKIISKRAH